MEIIEYADSVFTKMWSIISADGWLRHENRRIAENTRIAARLAVRSLRAERKSSHRYTWWM